MNIHPSHIPGVLTHEDEALRLQPADAAKVARRLYNDETTYDELHAVDVADASRAVDKALGAEHAVLEPRVKELVVAFALVTPAARACDLCHRLDLRRRPPWERDTRAACPCGGAWASAAFAAPVVAWTDGRTYPAGTEADDEGVPVTDRVMRGYVAEGGHEIHGGLQTALRNADLSLPAWAAWLLHRSHEFDARAPGSVRGVLRSLVDPSALALDAAALTRLVARAAREVTGTAQATNERGTTVTAAPAAKIICHGRDLGRDMPAPIYREVKRALASQYDTDKKIRDLCAPAGVQMTRVDMSGGADGIWYSVLHEAEHHHGLVERVVRRAAEDYPDTFLPFLGGSLVPECSPFCSFEHMHVRHG